MQFFQRGLFNFIFSFAHRNGFLDALGIFVANYFAYCVVIFVLLLIWRQKSKRARIAFFAEACLVVQVSRGIIVEIIHFLYLHPRPSEIWGITPLLAGSGSSFPSGYVTAYCALAAVVFVWHKRWGVALLVSTVFIGVARIFVGVDWPLDIVGGIVIAVASVWAVHALLRPYLRDLRFVTVADHLI